MALSAIISLTERDPRLEDTLEYTADAVLRTETLGCGWTGVERLPMVFGRPAVSVA